MKAIVNRNGSTAPGQMIPPPFARRHAEPLLERRIKKRQMMIPAVSRDAGNLDARIEQQVARMLQSQVYLMAPKWFPKFLNEEATQMTFAAMELSGQFGQGKF